MDAKIQEYNERLRNGFHYQSPGVKGAFSSNFKAGGDQGSLLLRNQYGAHIDSLAAMSPGEPRNLSSRMRGEALPGAAANYRTPQVGMKVDKVNKRLIINDASLLQGLQLYSP